MNTDDYSKHDNDQISGFFGEYRWLSNFHLCQIYYEGLIYPSTENAFQAAKSTILQDREKFTNIEPNKAKKLGRIIKIREDWDSIKLKVMKDVNTIKYNIPELKERLLATENKILIENNWWNDKFWGICNGIGENNLGKILMKIRSKICNNICNYCYGTGEARKEDLPYCQHCEGTGENKE